MPPKAGNMPTLQQQQSLSEEGSKENTILNGPRNKRERSAQGCPSGSADKMPQGPAPTTPTTQAGGPPQVPPVNSQNSDKYQKPHVLVANLFTIFTRTCSGSYTISWLECRQTNMFDAKTVILY